MDHRYSGSYNADCSHRASLGSFTLVVGLTMNFEAARARLIKHLSTEIKDKRVLAAMARIPRERFVPPEEQQLAYEDRPLPIGLEQTISQPFMTAPRRPLIISQIQNCLRIWASSSISLLIRTRDGLSSDR